MKRVSFLASFPAHLLVGFALLMPVASVAKDAAPPTPDYSPVLKQFRSQGVTTSYLGRKYGLDGWLLIKDNKIQVVYITPDGQGAVIGTLYGPSGTLETSAQLAEAQKKGLIPGAAAVGAVTPPAATTTAQPPAAAHAQQSPGAAEAAKTGEPPSELLWKQVEASTHINIGTDNAPILYAIMDPRCEYCQKLYTTLSTKYIPNNAVQLRVIPVGILGPDSVKDANEIISSPDSAKLWNEIEHFNFSELPTTIAPDAAAKTDANHKIMRDWNLTGTPSIIYRGKDGKVKVVLGIPEDMDAVISDLAPVKQ